MTDRELLELAAKAAGHVNYTCHEKCLFIETGSSRGSTGFYWDPLADDGDALRLAVRLSLWIRWQEDSKVNVCWYDEQGIFAGHVTEHGDDPCAATRRAIVRAAAEIGKEMEKKYD